MLNGSDGYLFIYDIRVNGGLTITIMDNLDVLSIIFFNGTNELVPKNGRNIR